MLNLHQIPAPPPAGEITACECEGMLRSHDPLTASRVSQQMVCASLL